MSDQAKRPQDPSEKVPLEGLDATVDQSKRESDGKPTDVSETIDQQPLDATQGSPAQTEPAKFPSIPGHEILGFIAKGGMGFVLKARHRLLERIVAIKLPLSTDTSDPEFQERFLREARAAAKLKHPQICPIYEVGEADGRPYIVLEYIPGETLGTWLQEESPTARDAAVMVAQLADAVQFAHDKGVLHRDIKPANVVIHAETKLPVLMDFGLAKETADQDSNLTQDGQVMGTPVYMAPEQAAGKIEQLGPAADVYALGAVLYHLICNQPPFSGTVGEVLRKVQTEDPPTPRSVTPRLHRDLETICLKAMSKSAVDRYASAGELAEDLARFSAGDAILARSPGPMQRLSRSVRRNPTVWSAAVGGLVLVALSTFLVGWAVDAAGRASLDRRIGELENSLDQDTQGNTEWNESQLALLDKRISELGELNSSRAAQWNEQVNQRMADSIAAMIGAPSLSKADADNIRADIERLQERDSNQTRDLRSQLQARVYRWQDSYQVESPIGQRPEWLPESVNVVNGRLVATSLTEGASHVRLKTPSAGRIEFEVRFNPPWSSATRLGLGFNDHGAQGYHMLLNAAKPKRSPANERHTGEPNSLATAQERRQLQLTLTRNGSPVKRWPLEFLPFDKPLTIRARREGSELAVWLNEKQHFRYSDFFPISSEEPGVFAIFVPPGTPITRVRVGQRLLPLDPSPLETADEYYHRGEFQSALEKYLSVDEGSVDEQVRRELQVKRAFCRLELDQAAQAEELLSKVMHAKGGRWPALASARLWAHYLSGGKQTEADAVLELLTSQYQFGELGAALPVDLQKQIFLRYENSVSSLDSLLRFDPDRLRDVERLAAVRELLGESDNSNTALLLIHAYRLNDRLDEAIEVAKREAERGNPGLAIEYCDCLCQKRQLELAAQELARLKKICAETEYSGWAVAEARIFGAQGRWGQVLTSTEELSHWPADPITFSARWLAYIRGMLLRGLAHRKTGYPVKAAKTWRDAVAAVREVRKSLPHSRKPPTQNEFYAFVLFGLAGEITEVELTELIRGFVKDNALVQVARFIADYQEIAEAVNQTWSSPRGLAVAEAIGVDRLSVRDRILQPTTLMMYGYVRPRVFKQPSGEQEQLLWNACEDAIRGLLLRNDLQLPQMMLLAAAFKGQEGFTGWGALSGGLNSQRRSRFAYLLGHRYLRINRPESVRKRLDEALKFSEKDSLTNHLAQTSQELLNKRAGRLIIQNPADSNVVVTIAQAGKARSLSIEKESYIDLPVGEHKLSLKSTDDQLMLSSNKVSVSLMETKTIAIRETPWREVARHFLSKQVQVNLWAANGSVDIVKPGGNLPSGRRQIIQLSALGAGLTDADLAVVRKVKTVRNLYLGNQPLVSEFGMRHFDSQPHLRTLMLGQLPFDDETAAHLNKSRIQGIGFSNSGRAAEGLAALAPSAPLYSLQIPSVFCTQDTVQHLRRHPGLSILWIYGPTIDVEFLAALRDLKNLRTIGLGVKALPPQALAKLPSQLSLLILNQDETELTDRHIQALQHITNLRLEIVNGDLNASAVDAFATCLEPRELVLGSSRVERAQAFEIAASRDDRSVEWRGQLVGAPKSNRQLAKDCLASGCKVSGWIASQPGAPLTPEVLEEDSPVLIRSAVLPAGYDAKLLDRLGSAVGLRYLRLEGKGVRAEHLQNLSKSSLYGLDLRGTPIDDRAVDLLLDLERVQQVDVRSTKITPGGVARLIGSQRLKQIFLDANHMTEEVAAALKRNVNSISVDIQDPRDSHIALLMDLDNLDALSLIGSKVEPANLAKLPRTLRRIRFGWSQQLTKDHIAALKHLNAVQLGIRQTPFDAEVFKLVAEMPNIESVELIDVDHDESQLEKLREIRRDLLIHVR